MNEQHKSRDAADLLTEHDAVQRRLEGTRDPAPASIGGLYSGSETAQLRREMAQREVRDDDRYAIQARLAQMERYEQAQQQGDAALNPPGSRCSSAM